VHCTGSNIGPAFVIPMNIAIEVLTPVIVLTPLGTS
jgi:hypothetical protein